MKHRKGSSVHKGTSAQAEKWRGPLLSVIIPAYNLEEDIALCLDSVLAQDVKEMEVLVVDNGSQDNTGAVIGRYAEKDLRIKPIYLPENRMPAGARNAALDIAQGKYVHFCDGDDMVPKGAYKELLRVAEEENAEVVTGNYSRKYPMEGDRIREFSHYQAKTGFERCLESGNTTLWNKIFRRSLIEGQHLRFSMNLRYHEDCLFYLQVMIQNPATAYTDKSVYIYTEPYGHEDGDKTASEIRYASARCVKEARELYYQIYAREIKHHQEIWFRAYSDNINWLLQCSWCIIQDPQEKRDAFNSLQNTLLEVQKTTTACDWTKKDHMQRFIEVVGTDFFTFCSMSFEEYLYLFYWRRGIRPKAANPMALHGWKILSGEKRDLVLAQNIEQIMEDIYRTYQNKISSARLIWKNHYYNLLDSVLNDYWRQISSRKIKEDLYVKIQGFVSKMREENALCAISSEADIERFQQVFCVDYATFQVLTCGQYMLLCTTSGSGCCGGSSSNGGSYYAPPPLEYYVTACRNGQIGMRGILKGFAAWLKYKLRKH